MAPRSPVHRRPALVVAESFTAVSPSAATVTVTVAVAVFPFPSVSDVRFPAASYPYDVVIDDEDDVGTTCDVSAPAALYRSSVVLPSQSVAEIWFPSWS